MMNDYEVIIIGGSFAGLSAGMTLGRSLRKTLIIDDGKPCNIKSPEAHNFITHDGRKPSDILNEAKRQVLKYDAISFLTEKATHIAQKSSVFRVTCSNGVIYDARKVLFATGVKDILPKIFGFEDCWGISILHCPYCHGFEVKNQKVGIIANGEIALEYVKHIHHWNKDLMLFTNGVSTISEADMLEIESLGVEVFTKKILSVLHLNGKMMHLIFDDESKVAVNNVYYRPVFEQHSKLPEQLGCLLDDNGLIKIDDFSQTAVKGIYAAGDNTTLMRSIANAVAMGNKVGAFMNMELINEKF